MTASAVWASADTLDGEGGASVNFAAIFFPSLLLRTGRKIWKSSPENLFVFSEQDLTKTGVKNRKPFLISCFLIAKNGGGYSVVIPRKQTCSLFLKRFLCRWGFCCPALSFSADCRSHLPHLTGSFRSPCSTRLQRFVSL